MNTSVALLELLLTLASILVTETSAVAQSRGGQLVAHEPNQTHNSPTNS